MNGIVNGDAVPLNPLRSVSSEISLQQHRLENIKQRPSFHRLETTTALLQGLRPEKPKISLHHVRMHAKSI